MEYRYSILIYSYILIINEKKVEEIKDSDFVYAFVRLV